VGGLDKGPSQPGDIFHFNTCRLSDKADEIFGSTGFLLLMITPNLQMLATLAADPIAGLVDTAYIGRLGKGAVLAGFYMPTAVA
jgi:hypothetical protein